MKRREPFKLFAGGPALAGVAACGPRTAPVATPVEGAALAITRIFGEAIHAQLLAHLREGDLGRVIMGLQQIAHHGDTVVMNRRTIVLSQVETEVVVPGVALAVANEALIRTLIMPSALALWARIARVSPAGTLVIGDLALPLPGLGVVGVTCGQPGHLRTRTLMNYCPKSLVQIVTTSVLFGAA